MHFVRLATTLLIVEQSARPIGAVGVQEIGNRIFFKFDVFCSVFIYGCEQRIACADCRASERLGFSYDNGSGWCWVRVICRSGGLRRYVS